MHIAQPLARADAYMQNISCKNKYEYIQSLWKIYLFIETLRSAHAHATHLFICESEQSGWVEAAHVALEQQKPTFATRCTK